MNLLHRCLHGAATVCALVNGAEVVAKVMKADFVVRNMGEVGVPPGALPALAAVEGAGTVGLLAGLLGSMVHDRRAVVLGEAAAGGLVLFFIGAVTTHLRAKVLHNVGFPAAYLLLAVTASVCLHVRAAALGR